MDALALKDDDSVVNSRCKEDANQQVDWNNNDGAQILPDNMANVDCCLQRAVAYASLYGRSRISFLFHAFADTVRDCTGVLIEVFAG